MAVRRADDALYVTEQAGRVRAIRNGALDPTPVLDLRDTVASGGERGLLGLAFSPDGGTLYVDYTNRNGDTRVDAYPMKPDGTADRSARRELLAIAQPQPNHNGGNLVTGPDGMLWISTGDGGAADDVGPGHAPGGNGQSLDTLLGKLLRIDPAPGPNGASHTIPPDNPFAGGGGRPEIWAYGLRNPWRFSFDADTGALVIGDVGQNRYEEIDWLPAGTKPPVNFGWNIREGLHEHRAGSRTGLTDPVLEYAHDDGRCSITGGYVYRGTKIPDLRGTYLYSDNCDGKLRGTPVGPGAKPEEIDFGLQVNGPSSFGQDDAKELYVLSLPDGVFRIDPA
jgi:glucose/arabinose dehydrogenase